MASTYELIASVTVGAGGASSIDFTSIPTTYTDLVVKLNLRNTATGSPRGWAFVRLNNDSSAIYDERMVYTTNGTSAASASNSNGTEISWNPVVGASATSNTFSNNLIYIPNYTGSSNKSFSIDAVTENNATEVALVMNACIWRSTSAINRITITGASSSTLAEYSTGYLYGIKNS